MHRETTTSPPHKNDMSLVCKLCLSYNLKENKLNQLTVSNKLLSLKKNKKKFRDRVSVVPCALSEGTATHRP